MSGDRILVAGHHLFLGKSIVERLQRMHAHALTTDVDFSDLTATLAYFERERPEVVIHCDIDTSGLHYLTEQPGEVFFRSTLASLHLQEAARRFGVKKFINPMASSTYPAGIHGKLKESAWWDGPFYETVSVIGLVRKNSWMNAYAFHKQYGMRYANVILANVYGPGDYFDESRSFAMGALIRRVVTAKLHQEPRVVIWGTGTPVRDWVFMDDAVDILLRAIDVEIGIEPVNIGTGRGISMAELAQVIGRVVGYTGSFVCDPSKPDGVPYRVMDIDRCRRVFRWEPTTGLEDGIRKTVQSYIAQRTHV